MLLWFEGPDTDATLHEPHTGEGHVPEATYNVKLRPQLHQSSHIGKKSDQSAVFEQQVCKDPYRV